MTTRQLTAHRLNPLGPLGAALVLGLAACGGAGSPTSEPTSPATPLADTASDPAPSLSPQTSPQPGPSATRSVRHPVTKSPVTKPPVAKPPAALKPFVVHIRSFAYVPPRPTVIAGQAIRVINDDTSAHTWSAAPRAGWAYTSGNLEKGQIATFRGFGKPGSYRFLCYYHAEMPSMNGVVSVKAAR